MAGDAIPPKPVTNRERNMRKDYERYQTYTQKALTPPTLDSRRAKRNLQECRRLFNVLKDHIRSELDPMYNDPAQEALARAYDDAWEVEYQNFDNWFMDREDEIATHEADQAVQDTQAEKLKQRTKLVNEYNSQKDIIENNIKAIRKSIPDNANFLSNSVYEGMKPKFESLAAKIDEVFKSIADKIEDIVMDHPDDFAVYHNTQLVAVHKLLDDCMATAISKLAPVATSTPNNSIMEGDQSNTSSRASVGRASQYGYTKRAFPKFDGSPRNFPRWYKEWKEVISQLFDDNLLVTMLDEATPGYVDLKHCETAEEAFLILTNRFANPVMVSSKLMDDFVAWSPDKSLKDELQLIQMERTVKCLYLDLKSIKEEKQITSTPFFIQRCIRHTPASYQGELLRALSANEKIDEPKSSYEVVQNFLTEKRETLERHGGWMDMGEIQDAESKADNSRKQKQQPFCQSCDARHPRGQHIRSKSVNHLNTSSNSVQSDSGASGGAQCSAIGSSKPDPKEKLRKKQEEYGKCPACHDYHSFTLKGQTMASSRFSDCKGRWNDLTLQQKADLLQKVKGCSYCLSWKHDKSRCNATWKKCRHKDTASSKI